MKVESALQTLMSAAWRPYAAKPSNPGKSQAPAHLVLHTRVLALHAAAGRLPIILV